MAEAFDSFNAPQFVDFSKEPEHFDDSVETYFDVDHESMRKERKNSEHENFYSPMESGPDSSAPSNGRDPLEKSYEEPVVAKLRKSMSVGNLILFNEEEFTPYLENIDEDIKKLNISQKVELKPQLPSNQQNKSSLRSSAASTTRWKGSQDHLNKLAQPKRYASVENLKEGNNGKFVSLAEAINQFQNRTPVRFRSKPNLAQNPPTQTLFRTVPESPALQTKARIRPIHILSQEEREHIEFEKQQKFKIKARPINKKILQGPIKPMVPMEKKAPTIPQPFKLTTVQPKRIVPSPQKYEFHAKPMPRSVEKQKKIQEIEKRPLTKPKTPSFMKNYRRKNSEETVTQEIETNQTDNAAHRKPTKPMPFSFDGRDKMIEKRREQLINKIMEEEKRAREFYANPVPKSIYRRGDSIKSDSGSSRNSSRRHPSTENLHIQFKARPATVLYKEPFIPVKHETHLTEAAPFALSTEQRAQERKEFEREKREKEERLEYFRRIEEEEMLRKEQEEIARLRKETQYKAKPIKKYKEVIIQPSNKVTEPISPNFQTDLLRKMKNKENNPNNCNKSC